MNFKKQNPYLLLLGLLIISNCVFVAGFFYVRNQLKMSRAATALWKEREGRRVKEMRVIYEDLIGKAHSVDITKRLDGDKISNFRKEGRHIFNMTSFGYNEKGWLQSVEVDDYLDKTLE
jgi:hypothetical protein